MEEVCRELDELRSEMKTLNEEYQDKLKLSENLRRALEQQFARYQEAKMLIEKQDKEIDAKVEEFSLSKKMYEELESQFAEKEDALKNMNMMNENLKASTGKKLIELEEKNRELAFDLDEANTKIVENERLISSYKEEIEGLKDLLSVSQKKRSDAEARAQAPAEVRRREEMLLKLEEEKLDIEHQLKWKMEQFRHLEEAHGKLRDEFQVAKKEWGTERVTLVNEIQTLQAKLDSQSVVVQDLHSKLKKCNQALTHEESRKKLLEVQISEYKKMYDNIFSDHEEAKSMIDALAAKRDEEVVSLRISLETKSSLVKEMEFQKAHLERENQELLTCLREYQDSQLNEASAASTSKVLRNKLRALENTHKSCSEKLKAKETERKTQLEKLEKDLDDCASQLVSKDEQISDLCLQLEDCQSSQMLLKLDNEEIKTVLMLVESKLFEACLVIENLKSEMAQYKANLTERVVLSMEPLEKKNAALIQAQSETHREHDIIESLQRRVDNLECVAKKYHMLEKELDTYKGMLEESCRKSESIKETTAKMEHAIQDDLKKTIDDLDRANCSHAEKSNELTKMNFERDQQSLILERMKKQMLDLETELNKYKVDLDTANCALAEKSTELSKMNLEMQQRSSVLERMEKTMFVLETELIRYTVDLERADCALAEKSIELSKMNFERQQQSLVLERMEKVKFDLEAELSEHKVDLDRVNCALAEKSTELSKMNFERQQQSLVLERMENSLFDLETEMSKCKVDLDRANCALAEKSIELSEMNFEMQQQSLALERMEKVTFDLETEMSKCKVDLDGANCALAEKSTELSKMNFELRQQSLVLERMEKVRFDLETELIKCKDDSRAIRNSLDVAVSGKMVAEKELVRQMENLNKLKMEKEKKLEELQKNVDLLEEDKAMTEFEIDTVFNLIARKISEVEKEFFEFANNINGKQKEIRNTVNMLEEKFMSRETTIWIAFEQEMAKYLHAVKDSENIVTGFQHCLLLLEEDVNNFVERPISQFEEKQAEIKTLAEDLEWLTATYVLKEQELQFKSILVAALEEEINYVLLKLKSEENLLFNSRNYVEQLEAKMSRQSLENEKKHAKLLSELKILQSEKIYLMDQLGKLEATMEVIHNRSSKLSSEKDYLTQEVNELNDILSTMACVDGELQSNMEKMMQKGANGNALTTNDKKTVLNPDIIEDNIDNSSLKNNARHDTGKRSPLKEHNF